MKWHHHIGSPSGRVGIGDIACRPSQFLCLTPAHCRQGTGHISAAKLHLCLGWHGGGMGLPVTWNKLVLKFTFNKNARNIIYPVVYPVMRSGIHDTVHFWPLVLGSRMEKWIWIRICTFVGMFFAVLWIWIQIRINLHSFSCSGFWSGSLLKMGIQIRIQEHGDSPKLKINLVSFFWKGSCSFVGMLTY